MKKMVKFPLILALTGTICATALGVVYQVANPIIEERVNAAANAAIGSVLPGAKGSDVTKKFSDKADIIKKYSVTTIYEVKDESGKDLGHGFKLSGQGRNGAIETLVLLNKEKVLGVKVLSHGETSSYYDKVIDAKYEDSFKDQKVDALDKLNTVAGATLSSKGIKGAVINARDAYKEIVLGETLGPKDLVTKEEFAKLGYTGETFELATEQFKAVQGDNYNNKFIGLRKDKNGISDAFYRKDASGNIVGYIYYFEAKYNCEVGHDRIDQTYRGLYAFDKDGSNTKIVVLDTGDTLSGAGFDYNMINMPLLSQLQGFNINEIKSGSSELPSKVTGASFSSTSIINVVKTICVNHKDF